MGEILPLNDENLERIYQDRLRNPAKAFRKTHDMGYGLGFAVFPENRYDPLKGVKRDTYNDHLELYYKDESRLDFDPYHNKKWDAHIKDYLDDFSRNSPFYNPKHKYYEDFEAARQNVALLRNIVYNELFTDGEYNHNDPRDKDNAKKVEEMGKEVGHILKWRAFWSNILPNMGRDRATRHFGEYGKEHIGAAELYRALLKRQNRISFNPLNWMQGKIRINNWNLPPIESTPFSSTDMVLAQFIEGKDQGIGMDDAPAHLTSRALMLESAAAALNRPQDMPPGDVRHSVDLAHTILDKLKKMNLGTSDRGLDARASERRDLEQSQAFVELASAYQSVLAGLAQTNPQALNDPRFEQARLAIGKLGHITLIEAMDACAHEKGHGEMLKQLIAAKDRLPAEFQQIEGVTTKELVKTIEEALHYAAEYQGIHMERNRSQGIPIDPAAQARVNASINQMVNTMSGVASRIGATRFDLIQEAQDINRANEMRQQTRMTQPSMQQAYQGV